MLAHYLAQHGAHIGFIVAPIAWMASVITRERRRSPGGDPAGPAQADGPTAPRRVGLVTLSTWAVVVTTIGAAAVHASIAPQHFSEGLIYGMFFTGLSIGQLAMAGIIAWKRDLRVVATLAAGNLCTIALWVLTRLVGIPGGPESGLREPFGTRDILASSLEAAGVIAAGFLLLRAARVGRSAEWVDRPRRMVAGRRTHGPTLELMRPARSRVSWASSWSSSTHDVTPEPATRPVAAWTASSMTADLSLSSLKAHTDTTVEATSDRY